MASWTRPLTSPISMPTMLASMNVRSRDSLSRSDALARSSAARERRSSSAARSASSRARPSEWVSRNSSSDSVAPQTRIAGTTHRAEAQLGVGVGAEAQGPLPPADVDRAVHVGRRGVERRVGGHVAVVGAVEQGVAVVDGELERGAGAGAEDAVEQVAGAERGVDEPGQLGAARPGAGRRLSGVVDGEVEEEPVLPVAVDELLLQRDDARRRGPRGVARARHRFAAQRLGEHVEPDDGAVALVGRLEVDDRHHLGGSSAPRGRVGRSVRVAPDAKPRRALAAHGLLEPLPLVGAQPQGESEPLDAGEVVLELEPLDVRRELAGVGGHAVGALGQPVGDQPRGSAQEQDVVVQPALDAVRGRCGRPRGRRSRRAGGPWTRRSTRRRTWTAACRRAPPTAARAAQGRAAAAGDWDWSGRASEFIDACTSATSKRMRQAPNIAARATGQAAVRPAATSARRIIGPAGSASAPRVQASKAPDGRADKWSVTRARSMHVRAHLVQRGPACFR